MRLCARSGARSWNGDELLKRAIDLALCVAVLPLALPLCLLLLAAVRIESRGAPLFVQVRVGRHQRPFRLLKLRTMAADTSDLPSHEVDPAHITRVGAWLRRTKLDELPQLLNVIAGSMSLVGPRPCLYSQVELIAEREKHGLFRYRPGVTGPAQLLGIDMSQPRLLAEAEANYFRAAGAIDDVALILRTALGGGSGDAAIRPR